MIPIITQQWTFPTNQRLKGKDGNASATGVAGLRDIMADHFQRVATVLTDYHTVGTLAQRPPAGSMGRHFYATDVQTMFEDIGSSWVPIGGAAAISFILITANAPVSPANTLYIVDAGTGTVTLTLPAATGSGFAPRFKRVSPQGNLVLQPSGTDTLDGTPFSSGYLVTSIWRSLQLLDYTTGGWAIL